MQAQKEFSSLVVEAINQVHDTQGDLQFLTNVMNAYLEGSISASPSDIYGFLKLCKGVHEQLCLCEEVLEGMRGK